MTQASTHTPQTQTSPWAPLRQPVFRALWIAALASNIGTWMQDVGAGWLMTSLSTSPWMVALVQAATSLPIMLLALPSGALADIVDRRRLLLLAQGWMLLAAAVLGGLTLAGLTTVESLLGFTLALGLGSAFTFPAWAAIVPELVPRQDLHAAVALNGLAMNASRAVGPAVAGYLVALTSPGVVFLLNALSFLGIIAVLSRWKHPPNPSGLPAERLAGAIQSGLRYVRHSRTMRSVLIRAGAFFFFGSASWALLPLWVRQGLHGGAGDYGLTLTAVGLGAVLGVFALPRLRGWMGIDVLQKSAATLYAAMLALLAWAPDLAWLWATALVSGVAWLIAITCLQGVAQTALPAWVRARGLALVMMVFMGGMAGGSLAWGRVATALSVPEALRLAAAGLALGVLATWRVRLLPREGVDLTRSMHWPAPAVDQTPEPDRGPVLVTVAYRVDPGHLAEFLGLMARQGAARRRSGAFYWQLFQDAAAGDAYLETFLTESWLEHLRQHERVTQAERVLQEKIRRCLLEPAGPPVVSHYLAVASGGGGVACG